MGSRSMQEHKHWLLIAQEDLDSAKHLFSVPFMTVLFHVQQCAEKSLKAFFVFKKQNIIKTHDLIRLVDVCLQFDREFEVLRQLAAELTPYETAGRYPDNTFQKPSQEKIASLIEQSEYIFNFVVHRIGNLDVITNKR